jgi:hypothetical protein
MVKQLSPNIDLFNCSLIRIFLTVDNEIGIV